MRHVYQIFGWRENGGWTFFNTVRGTEHQAREACNRMLKVTDYTGTKYVKGDKV